MRTNIPNTLRELIEHPFSKKVMQQSLEVKKEIYGDNLIALNPEPKRLPNEIVFQSLFREQTPACSKMMVPPQFQVISQK